MRKSHITIPLVIFLVLVTLGTAAWIFSSRKAAPEIRIQTIEPTVAPTEKIGTPSATTAAEKTPTVRPQISLAFFLEVLSPEEGATVKTNWVEVKGRTNSDSEVFVNETQVYPDKDGNFQKSVSLTEGENYIVVSAGNDKGDSEIERLVYYEK